MSFTLTEQDRKILLDNAREAIAARLESREPRYPCPTPVLATPCGAFVTLKTDGQLRGCIGQITASRPLVETVREMAQSSAFEDPRFPPVHAGEWTRVHIEISVLSPFEPVRDVGLIQAGVHGVMIRRGHRSGLLLPQVATEHGWDRETFLTHVCHKAGLPADSWRAADVRMEMFSAQVFGEKEQGS
jgi:uncharacterized protein